MSKRILIALVMMAGSTISYAQTERYRFDLAFLEPDNSTLPAAYYEIKFNGKVVKANDAGTIFIDREASSPAVQVSMLDAAYVLVGPSAVPFPDNAAMVTTILLHKKTNKEQAVTALSSELKKINVSLSQAVNKDDAASKKIAHALDSLLGMVTSQYRISEMELKSAVQLAEGREKYYPQITYALESYLNEAKDIRDIFKNMLAFSLQNPKSFFLFDSTIKVYNKFYNELNNNNNEYEKAVQTYWKSDELASGFHNVFDYAINDIHRTSILTLNTLFVQKANMYIHTDSRKERKQLKQEIIASLNAVMPILDNNLVVLENKIKYHIGKLDAGKNIF